MLRRRPDDGAELEREDEMGRLLSLLAPATVRWNSQYGQRCIFFHYSSIAKRIRVTNEVNLLLKHKKNQTRQHLKKKPNRLLSS